VVDPGAAFVLGGKEIEKKGNPKCQKDAATSRAKEACLPLRTNQGRGGKGGADGTFSIRVNHAGKKPPRGSLVTLGERGQGGKLWARGGVGEETHPKAPSPKPKGTGSLSKLGNAR